MIRGAGMIVLTGFSLSDDIRGAGIFEKTYFHRARVFWKVEDQAGVVKILLNLIMMVQIYRPFDF